MSKEKTVTKNNITKTHLTQEELAQLMGLSVPTKTITKTPNNSLKKVIADRVNEVIHETLCKEFGEYYFEIGDTIVQHTRKSGEILASKVQGYKLVLPKKDCKLANGKTQKGYQIGKPT